MSAFLSFVAYSSSYSSCSDPGSHAAQGLLPSPRRYAPWQAFFSRKGFSFLPSLVDSSRIALHLYSRPGANTTPIFRSVTLAAEEHDCLIFLIHGVPNKAILSISYCNKLATLTARGTYSTTSSLGSVLSEIYYCRPPNFCFCFSNCIKIQRHSVTIFVKF